MHELRKIEEIIAMMILFILSKILSVIIAPENNYQGIDNRIIFVNISNND